MSRVRLTNRKAADMSVPYPGNVNQPNRKDPSWEQYHTFEQRVNHELPDMRHDWQSDERDDVGFGVSEPWGESPKVPGALPPPPTVASVRVAATKAVRIAVLLLGEKVDDKVIEEQARDMMSMSGSAMDRTLARFSDTQALYGADEKVDDKDEKKATDDKDEDDKKASDDADKDDEKKAAKKDDEKEAAKKDDDKKAEDKKDEPPAFIKEKIEESKKGSKSLAEKKAEDKVEDEKKATDDADKDEKKATDDADKDDKKAKDDADEKKAEDEAVEEKKAGSNELGIELGAADEEEEEMDEKTAAQLQSLFEDKASTAAEELEQKPESSKKAGIKKLGGQPRVASADGAGATDISNIWQSAPDVSELFR